MEKENKLDVENYEILILNLYLLWKKIQQEINDPTTK